MADALGNPTPPSSRSPSPGLSAAQEEYDGAPCPESPPSLAVRMQRQTMYYRGQFMAEDSSTVDDVPAVPLSAHVKTRSHHSAQAANTSKGPLYVQETLLPSAQAAAARKAQEKQGNLGARRMSMDTILESPNSFYTAQEEGPDSPSMQSAESSTPMSIQSTGRMPDPSPGSGESGKTAETGALAAGFAQSFAPTSAPIQQTIGRQPAVHVQQPSKHGLAGTAFAPGSSAAPVSMFDFQPVHSAAAAATTTIDSVCTGSNSFSSSWSTPMVEQAAAFGSTFGAPNMAPANTAMGAGFGGFVPVSGPQCSPVGFKTYSARSLDSYAFSSGTHVRMKCSVHRECVSSVAMPENQSCMLTLQKHKLTRSGMQLQDSEELIKVARAADAAFGSTSTLHRAINFNATSGGMRQ